MFVVDFMGFLRKLPIKKLKLQTFEDLASKTFKMILSLAKQATRIDVTFDIYNSTKSIKARERLSRGLEHISLASISNKQKLPDDILI